jgi:hypothetical protein
MPLEGPPHSLDGFPETTAPDKLYRIHRIQHDPLFYSSSGDGRFDLEPPGGTLYTAASPRGAFIEVLRMPLVPSTEVQARALSRLVPLGQLGLADCTSPAAAAYGVTAEIHSTRDYELCQRWAAAFVDAGFDGVAYYASHDPSAGELSVAIFRRADQGEQFEVDDTAAISAALIEDVEQHFAIVVVPVP